MGDETIHALREVSFTVDRGEYVAIVGTSGSGKSTLLNILGCLDTPSSGTYRLRGADVAASATTRSRDLRNREIGFVFQTFQLLAADERARERRAAARLSRRRAARRGASVRAPRWRASALPIA